MYQPEYEAMPRPELEQLQLERLRSVFRRVYDNVDFYKKAFDEAGVTPEIQSLGDLEKYPFTLKDDLRAGYPYKMFAAPLRDIVRVHSSSGTDATNNMGRPFSANRANFSAKSIGMLASSQKINRA